MGAVKTILSRRWSTTKLHFLRTPKLVPGSSSCGSDYIGMTLGSRLVSLWLPAIGPRKNISMCQAPAGVPTARLLDGVAWVIGLLSRRLLIGPLPVKRDIRQKWQWFLPPLRRCAWSFIIKPPHAQPASRFHHAWRPLALYYPARKSASSKR